MRKPAERRGRSPTLECLTARALEDREPNVVHGKAVRPKKAVEREKWKAKGERRSVARAALEFFPVAFSLYAFNFSLSFG